MLFDKIKNNTKQWFLGLAIDVNALPLCLSV
uniref:Uncharacterized protein n=1 Tax=Tetranychus urticae TaxID=32264 RepID=T1KGF5_TETUR